MTSTISQPLPHFCAPLPFELREHAEAMSWSAFTDTYSPSDGLVRLRSWECDERGARLGPQPRRFCATLVVGDRIETATVHASGPVAALTAMLYDRGVGVEMTRFHQLAAATHTATFVQGSDGRRREWAMGWSEDATESALQAIIACANRLIG
jgi:hypothetical protein